MNALIQNMGALYRSSPMPVLLFDTEWRICWANDYAREKAPLLCNEDYLQEVFFGESGQELLGKLNRGEVLRVVQHRFLGEELELTLTPHFVLGRLRGVEGRVLPVLKKGEEGVYTATDYAGQVVDLAVAHLREPLTQIFSLIDPLVQRLETTTTGRLPLEYVRLMTEQSYAMLAGLINLSEYSRCMGGTAVPDIHKEDLVARIQTLCDAANLFFLGAGLSLEFAPEMKTLEACADFVRLDIALLNLLLNAANHSYEGGTVRIALSRRGDHALLAVSDSGCGMDADQVQNAFSPLALGEDGTAPAGYGLGLGVVKRILQLHGGTVALSSTLGVGTTVSLSLPLRQELEPPLPPPSGEFRAIPPSPYLENRFSPVYVFLSGVQPLKRD